jgi:hypothetical protein
MTGFHNLMISLRATMIGRALGVCTAQQLSLVGNSIWRTISGITNHVRGSPEETYGDDHRGCDVGDDAVVDALRVVNGIPVVARSAGVGLITQCKKRRDRSNRRRLENPG